MIEVDPSEDKITRDEMMALFGEEIPVEAMMVVFGSPPDWTVAQVRDKIRSIAKEKYPHVFADSLARLLHKAGEQFAYYGAEHRKKGTDSGNTKALVNEAWAKRCFDACEAWENSKNGR